MTHKQYNNDSTKDYKKAGSTINKDITFIDTKDIAELRGPNQWTNNTIHIWKQICIKHLKKIMNYFISEISWDPEFKPNKMDNVLECKNSNKER